ncbi:SphA family protein [Paraburkholderia sediminicola]|uniref:SphA family protein n=1 Tax=Paraburkholderia sediminicola TaxID=458836 RepID=UPI0038BBA453
MSVPRDIDRRPDSATHENFNQIIDKVDKMFRIPKYIVVIFIQLALCSLARASEGAYYGGPVGGTDLGNAYLPARTGFYGGIVAGAGHDSTAYGNDGHALTNVKVSDTNVYEVGFGLLYVYPFKLFGGTLASSVQIPLKYGHIDLSNDSTYIGGFSDTYSDLLVWSKYIGSIDQNPEASPLPLLPYGLTVKLAYSMIFPTGKYNATQIASPGHNDFFYIPNFAFTYLTRPNFLGDGFEISAHVFLDFASRNHQTNYSTGPVGDIDFALTERMGPWQVGLAGYYAKQWEDDVQNGQIVGGNGKKLEALGMGPVVAYTIPAWKTAVKLKVLLPVAQRNTLGSSTVFLSAVRSFQ